MQEVERFVQLRLEVKILPEFGPAPDETAQPIAMGRQVLWGGRGRAPGREVMTAAARQARQEMMQRLRERNNKPTRSAPPTQSARDQAAPANRGNDHDDDDPLANDPHFSRLSGQPSGGGAPGTGNNNRRRRRNRSGNGSANGGGGGRGAAAETGVPSGARQPDPLRTSIDSLGRGGGGGRNGNRNRGRSGGGGGGGGARGPADPLRTNFGRLK